MTKKTGDDATPRPGMAWVGVLVAAVAGVFLTSRHAAAADPDAGPHGATDPHADRDTDRDTDPGAGAHEAPGTALAEAEETMSSEVTETPGRPFGSPPAARLHSKSIEARAERSAVNTRALLEASMATKRSVSPVGIVGLALCTVWLFLAEDILSIPLAVDSQHFVLDNTGLAIVLGFSVVWWYASGPRNIGAAVLCVLCAVVVLLTAAGIISAPDRGRWTDLVVGIVILACVAIRSIPFGTEES